MRCADGVEVRHPVLKPVVGIDCEDDGVAITHSSSSERRPPKLHQPGHFRNGQSTAYLAPALVT